MEKVRPWCGQPSDRGQLKNRIWNMADRIAEIPMTLSDLQGHSPTACLFRCFRITVQQLTFPLTSRREVPLRYS